MKLPAFLRRGKKKSEEPPPPAREAGPEDLQKLLRALRRQTLETERLAGLLEEDRRHRHGEVSEAAMEAADAFHYLCRALQETDAVGSRTRQALNMVWARLERVLALSGLRMVRDEAVPFDPRIHEAVGREDIGSDGPTFVSQVVQPGFIASDRVIRPAKVIVSTPHCLEQSTSAGAPL